MLASTQPGSADLKAAFLSATAMPATDWHIPLLLFEGPIKKAARLFPDEARLNMPFSQQARLVATWGGQIAASTDAT
jgi:hypothetical protein